MNRTLLIRIFRIGRAGALVENVPRFNSINTINSARIASVNRNLDVGGCARFRSTGFGKERGFHTTRPNNLHPLIWVVVRPIAKLLAMGVGRGVRKWWAHLPLNKRALFMQALHRRRYRILGSMVIIGGVAFIYYESHIQESSILKRRRFIAFNSSQILELADFQMEMLKEDFDGKTCLENHPFHKRAQNVVNRIITANSDIPEISEKSWLVTVVAIPIDNAFVLPNGQIFIFKGMLDLCLNDDQLGIILGHEIAHAILNHGAENMSYLHLLDLLTIIMVGAIWAILPSDIVSALVQWMMHKLVHVLVELPYSRQLEVEADEIGLHLSAKACFDVRESPAFWQRLSEVEKADGSGRPAWLSTHPAHEARSTILEEKLPQALSLRLACKCPPLPAQDPRRQKMLAVPI